MARKFKIGDRVICNNNTAAEGAISIGSYYTVGSDEVDDRITLVETGKTLWFASRFILANYGSSFFAPGVVTGGGITISAYGGGGSAVLDNSLTNKKMDLKESFMLAFKSEPEKSLRKAGITNGDDFLTSEGQNVFLSWLLKKHAVEFKTEVVDEILKEEEKK